MAPIVVTVVPMEDGSAGWLLLDHMEKETEEGGRCVLFTVR